MWVISIPYLNLFLFFIYILCNQKLLQVLNLPPYWEGEVGDMEGEGLPHSSRFDKIDNLRNQPTNNSKIIFTYHIHLSQRWAFFFPSPQSGRGENPIILDSCTKWEREAEACWGFDSSPKVRLTAASSSSTIPFYTSASTTPCPFLPPGMEYVKTLFPAWPISMADTAAYPGKDSASTCCALGANNAWSASVNNGGGRDRFQGASRGNRQRLRSRGRDRSCGEVGVKVGVGVGKGNWGKEKGGHLTPSGTIFPTVIVGGDEF